MSITQQRPRAGDLLQRMGPNLYREAYARGMSLSAFLEHEDPSAEYKDGLDAFSRVLKVAGIKTRSDPEAGYFADKFEAFGKDDATRALVPEWAARTWRRVANARHGGARAVYASTDVGAGAVLRPYTDAAIARTSQLAPAIPLGELIAVTTPIDSDAYRATYLIDDPAQSRLVRIAQGAEIPRAKLVTSDRTIRLFKYGRALETTYEVLRRQRIDMVALHIARMAIQAETDKVATAVDVLINGDGNPGTAATNFNLSALDAAAGGALTLRAWLAFKLKFANPYAITVALTQEAAALALLLLNTGSANVPLVNIQGAAGFGGFRPINPELADNVGLGITTDAPSGRIVGADTRFALERATEIGSNISEVERFVMRQTQAITLTEVEGYATIDAKATKTLTLTA